MTTGRFQKGPNYRTPFGKNEWLGSTKGLRFESWTVACAVCPSVTIDGNAMVILDTGQIMAKITSAAGGTVAADVGKVGPFDSGASDGRQTKANIIGINNTFLPWQLNERDVDIAIVYEGVGNSANVHGYESGVQKTLDQLVTDSILALTDFQGAKMQIIFRQAATAVLGPDYGQFPLPS